MTFSKILRRFAALALLPWFAACGGGGGGSGGTTQASAYPTPIVDRFGAVGTLAQPADVSLVDAGVQVGSDEDATATAFRVQMLTRDAGSTFVDVPVLTVVTAAAPTVSSATSLSLSAP